MRLMRLLALFQAKPHGLTPREIADCLEVSQRTAQRDLLHLQSELHVPFVDIGSRWVLPSRFFLAPVSLNVHEGMAMRFSRPLPPGVSCQLRRRSSCSLSAPASALPKTKATPLRSRSARSRARLTSSPASRSDSPRVRPAEACSAVAPWRCHRFTEPIEYPPGALLSSNRAKTKWCPAGGTEQARRAFKVRRRGSSRCRVTSRVAMAGDAAGSLRDSWTTRL
jgi:hypothetical protein